MKERIPTADELNSMSDVEFKVFENRCRRAAGRQGFSLIKSRSRDPRAVDYGTYRIVDPRTNGVVACADYNDYGLGLDDVAEFLFGLRCPPRIVPVAQDVGQRA
jgi:hypothetical protein